MTDSLQSVEVTSPAGTSQPTCTGLDDLEFIATLSKGYSSRVLVAKETQSAHLFAVKVVSKRSIIENDEVERIKAEKRVFLMANEDRHPFLTNLHACFQTEASVYFVMELVSGDDLMWHIQQEAFCVDDARFYAAEAVLALKFFHDRGVIYRNLKLENIRLLPDGHIKVINYGFCKNDMWHGSTTSTFCGTQEFMAPEILLDKRYGRAVDWWAFGIVLYQMLLRKSPFSGEDEDEIYDSILASEPDYPTELPKESVSILQGLLKRDPSQRLGSGTEETQEVMNHPFFQGVDWDDLYHKRIRPPSRPVTTSAVDNAVKTSNLNLDPKIVVSDVSSAQSALSDVEQEHFRDFSYFSDSVV